MSLILSQLLRDGLWLATCMLAVAAIIGAGTFAVWLLGAYTAKTRRATAAQHHAPPYAHRQPGQTLAAIDDRHIWQAATLHLPPHRGGHINWRRRTQRRLHRDLELLLCHAAAGRPRDDA